MKKECSLVIPIRILDVILSDFYLLQIANQCPINKKSTLFKSLSLSQESNIKQSSFTKDSSIHQKYSYVLFYATTYYTPNSLYKNKRPLELYIYNYDSLFHYLKTGFIFLS